MGDFFLSPAHVARVPAGNTEDICRKVVSAINKDEAAAIKCRARRSRFVPRSSPRDSPIAPCSSQRRCAILSRLLSRSPLPPGSIASLSFSLFFFPSTLPRTLSLTLTVSLTPRVPVPTYYYLGPRALLHRFISAPSNRRETRRATVKAASPPHSRARTRATSSSAARGALTAVSAA